MTNIHTTRFTQRGQRRRESLLDAAERSIVALGSTDVSMRAISAEAGVRVGHLQHYFPTRAELVQAVLERVLARSLQALADLGGQPERKTSATDSDANNVVNVVLAEQDDPATVRLFVEIWGMAARDDTVATVLRRFYADYVGLVGEFLRHRKPYAPPDEIQARAECFVALFEGVSLLRSGIAGDRSGATDTVVRNTAIELLTR